MYFFSCVYAGIETETRMQLMKLFQHAAPKDTSTFIFENITAGRYSVNSGTIESEEIWRIDRNQLHALVVFMFLSSLSTPVSDARKFSHTYSHMLNPNTHIHLRLNHLNNNNWYSYCQEGNHTYIDAFHRKLGRKKTKEKRIEMWHTEIWRVSKPLLYHWSKSNEKRGSKGWNVYG